AHLDGILCDFISQLVGLAEAHSGSYASARHPDGKRAGIVIAPNKFHFLPSAIFSHRSPPELAAPHDQCVFHHSTFFQIFQQSGDGLIDLPASLRETDVQSFPGTRTVAIPSPVIKLNKAHTAFGKTPGYQTIV